MARRTIAKEGPHPIDVHVGARVRLRRTLSCMSQTQLGQRLGLTFQQIQKYERGRNRISASRLYQMSHILDVPVSFFFDDIDGEGAARSPDEILLKRETIEFVRAYYRIGDPAVRKRLFAMTEVLADLPRR